MKLKKGLITHEADGEQIMVGTGDANFAGLVRSNRTAAFLVNLLREDTTREALVEAMCAKYDAPAGTIARDVDRILDTLRSIGALDETDV